MPRSRRLTKTEPKKKTEVIEESKEIIPVEPKKNSKFGPRNKNTWVQLTEDQIKQALTESHGLVSLAAKKLKIYRQALQDRLKNNPDLRKFQQEIATENVEIIHDKLFEKALNGDFRAQEFYLKTIGRSAGFGDHLEISGQMMNVNLDFNYDGSKLTLEEKKVLYGLLAKCTPINTP